MGSSRRSLIGESLGAPREGARGAQAVGGTLRALALGLLLAGCASRRPGGQVGDLLHQSANESANAQKVLLGQEFKFNDGRWRQLTLVGDNHSPVPAKEGDRIVFLSAARNAHSNAQVYLFDLVKNAERRMTFSDGDTPEALIANGDLFYVSDTEVAKERPAIFAGSHRDNDVFRLAAQAELPERLTAGDKRHAGLALGKTAVLWTASNAPAETTAGGAPGPGTTGAGEAAEARLYAYGKQGVSALGTIPTGIGTRVQVDAVKGYWAWIQRRKTEAKPRLYLKSGEGAKPEEIPVEVNEATVFRWWTLATGSYLWIERRGPAGLEGVVLYDPAKKCAAEVAVANASPKNGVLQALLPFRAEGGFLAVVGTAPARQIYQSTTNLGRDLIKALDNGMPCSGPPLSLN